MEGMVGKYWNPEYLPIDPDCNADHIPNTVIITKRVYDILCNGVGIFDDTAVRTAHDRGDPLQNSVCHLMIGLIMFKRKEFKEEMHKKFHVG